MTKTAKMRLIRGGERVIFSNPFSLIDLHAGNVKGSSGESVRVLQETEKAGLERATPESARDEEK